MQERDWSLRSGERQTSPWFEDANAAHRARYAWAASVLGHRFGQRGLDIFCATGYGTAHLARHTGAAMVGHDACAEAIDVAARAYPNIAWTCAHYPYALPSSAFDFIVSLESIEHVEDDAAFVASLIDSLRPGGDLLLSVPNEERLPCASFGNPYHVRHYAPAALTALFAGPPVEIVGEYAQRIHAFRDTAWGPQRHGRIPEAEQAVYRDAHWSTRPCALLAHVRRLG